jgi:hypothetical protein
MPKSMLAFFVGCFNVTGRAAGKNIDAISLETFHVCFRNIPPRTTP